jgi:ribonuclease Z
MEPIKITFLGTGSAIPTKLHNHPAILLSYKNENILFDCGEGTQRQFRYADLSASKITRLFITHWHGDHILGIPGLLQTLALNSYQKKLHIYGPRGTSHHLSNILRMFIFEGAIDYEIHEISSETAFENSDFKIEAKELSHSTKCLAYSFVEKDKLRLKKDKIKKLKLPNSPLLKEIQQGKDITLNGKKIKAKSLTYLQEGRKVSLVLDTSYNESIPIFVKNSNILIAESTYSSEEAELAKEKMHLTTKDAATIAKKAKAEQLYLVHLSQKHEHLPNLIEKEAKSIFKNTKVAKDLDIIEIG